MAIYKYPNNIRDPKYKHRFCLIEVRKQSANANDSELIAQSKDSINGGTNFVKVAAGTVKEMWDNKNINGTHRNKFSDVIDTIILPIPNSLSDTQSHEWSNTSGIVGTIGTELMRTTIGDITPDITKGKGPVGTIVKGVLGAVAKASSGISADQALGSISSNLGLRKPLANPGYFQNYSGSAPRTFRMSWSLIPDNTEEAQSILSIIMKLKQYSSPEKDDVGISMLAPHFFSVHISNKYIDTMIDLERVVISSIDVDYGADGAMQQTEDGMPKFISLTLSFNEIDMKTQQDYNTVPGV